MGITSIYHAQFILTTIYHGNNVFKDYDNESKGYL